MRGLRASALAISTSLAARQRQVLDQRGRMDVGSAGAGESGFGQLALRATVDHAEPRGRVGDDDVVGDAEFGDQRQFLEDADDAGVVGGSRRREIHGATFHCHGAFVGRHDAGHDLDQGRLSRAIFPEDGVNTTRHDR